MVRGIRDLEATQRAYAEAEVKKGFECESAKKFADAVVHYRNAAEFGHFGAHFRLGEMYQAGRGVPQSSQEASVWLARIREAAERGDKEAQVKFGFMYCVGVGVTRDYAEAVSWWRRADEQGDAEAAAHLSSAYHWGHGVPEDHEEEERWSLRAAAQGNPWACYQLGIRHVGGGKMGPAELLPEAPPEVHRVFANVQERDIVCKHEEDLVKAYMWFKLGAMKEGLGQGMCEIWCELIHGGLSASQIAEAERLAREWEAAVDKASRGKS